MKGLKWLPIILWVVVISYLSFSSLESIQIPKFFSADKIGHFLMYFILEILFLIPLGQKADQIKWATFFAILFSGFTELIQHYFIENRFGELFDFASNLLGIGVGVVFLKRIKFNNSIKLTE